MTHVHLIGIGGTGLSAIARVLLESGYTVTGSDRQLSPLAESLREAGVTVYEGHQPQNVQGADLVVRSSAIPDQNIEVQAARGWGIPVLKRADFLAELMEDRYVIAVAGSHGKTSTTAMIAWVLTCLEQDPGFIVGGVVSNLQTNAHAGSGPHFVIEADEYDRMFLGLRPNLAVITNVEHDHPDLFPTPEVFEAAFRDFVGCLTSRGILLACGDDPAAAALLPVAQANGKRTIAYGIRAPELDYRAKNLKVSRLGTTFEAFCGEEFVATVSLNVPGEHNVQNSLAALAVVHLLGFSPAEAAEALSRFQGSGRRFEVVGEVGGITVIDDYAHHPTEIRATLAAARARYPGRELWAIWQPHTYSRTQTLFDDFAASFVDADHVVVSEVFRSREAYRADFSARQVVQSMRHPDAHFVANLPDVTSFVLARLRSGDVLLVLSAGDANQICEQVLAGLNPLSQPEEKSNA